MGHIDVSHPNPSLIGIRKHVHRSEDSDQLPVFPPYLHYYIYIVA